MDQQVLQDDQLVVMDDLVEKVCWDLVAGGEFARIGFVIDGKPWILPVNYRLMGQTVVFRTTEGSMLDALGNGAAVVVELDHVDQAALTGWSVLVRGTAQAISSDVLPVVDGSVHPWAPGDKDRWLWVLAEAISGRAISRHVPAPKLRLPYMPLG